MIVLDACADATLGEGLAAPLVTLDARLARAPGHRARIDLVGGAAGSGQAG